MVFATSQTGMKGQTNHNILEEHRARNLRNAPTDAERQLWQRLRARQLESCKFRRQHPFGDYILDFACLERNVIVELDGSQHMDATDYDSRRTQVLVEAGFIVLRFWNNDVFANIEDVLEVIQRELIARATPSPPNPPLEGEG
jgi:very-short-patch-repair endonuclease